MNTAGATGSFKEFQAPQARMHFQSGVWLKENANFLFVFLQRLAYSGKRCIDAFSQSAGSQGYS